MQLKIALETLVPQPAIPATPAGPDTPVQLTYLPQSDPHRMQVKFELPSGVSRTWTYTKLEAMSIGNMLVDWANGKLDVT